MIRNVDIPVTASEALKTYVYPPSFLAVEGNPPNIPDVDTYVRRSESLPVFSTEATAYFVNMAINRTPYYDLVARAEADLAKRWPLQDERVTVAIAVASHQEGEVLYDTLLHYANESDVRQFEVLLFLNRPDRDSKGRPTNDRRSNTFLRKFMNEYPEVPIRTFTHTFEGSSTIGAIKGMLHDVTALRHLRAGSVDPIMILNDADLKHASQGYIDAMVTPFDQDAATDVVMGHLDWDHADFKQFPQLHVATRLYQMIDRFRRHQAGIKMMAGANTAIRLSTYCAAGGTPHLERGEDIAVGQSVRDLRGGIHTFSEPLTAEGIIQSSLRRSIVAMRQGLGPNEKWKMGFGVHDDTVRDSAKLQQMRNRSSRDQSKLASHIRYLTERVINAYGEDVPVNRYETVLGELGIKAVVSGEAGRRSLSKTDMAEAFNTLEAFRAL
jgi:hypothetical protein